MQVLRHRDDGDIFHPHKNRAGQYVLGDPKHGSSKHHAPNKVIVATLEQAVQLVERQGFSFWMKGQKSKQTNLISADQIEIIR